MGIVAFLSIPIVFFYSITLEPLIWVCFFSMGAGFWALRIGQTSASRPFFIFGLGIFCVLTGNAKNNGMALIPAGAAAVLSVILFRDKGGKIFKKILGALKTYAFATFLGLTLSGLGLLLIQILVLYGSFISSDLRKEQVIAELSPCQIYVHTVRIGSVLAEIPLPCGNQFVERIGNQIIDALGADKPLPKEQEWRWVGHYRYSVEKWPGVDNFGIAGFLILLSFTVGIFLFLKNFSKGNISEHFQSLIRSEKLAYAIVAFALLLLTAYLLRWFIYGTRSFLAPGVVSLLLLALSYLCQKKFLRIAYPILLMGIVIFGGSFAAYEGYKLVERVGKSRFKWSNISHSFRFRIKIVEENVPKNAVLLLLVGPNFMDYSVFGREYSRKVIQITETLSQEKIAGIAKKYPGAYIFVYGTRYKNNVEVLKRSVNIVFIDQADRAGEGMLFKVIPEAKG